MIQLNHQRKKEVKIMSKVDFLRKYRNDYVFRAEMRAKGIKVIQDNVIFFNPDGTVKAIAGAYVM
jgi:hypothetical protein